MQAAARARRRSVRRSCAPSFGAWIVLLTLVTFLHGPAYELWSFSKIYWLLLAHPTPRPAQCTPDALPAVDLGLLPDYPSPEESGWSLVPPLPRPEGTLRVALVTLCDGELAELCAASADNKLAYARRHGYTLLVSNHLIDRSRPTAWSKILAVREALDSGFQLVMCVDADALIMNPQLRVEELFDWTAHTMLAADHNGPNSGVWLVRDSEWTRQLLSALWEEGGAFVAMSPLRTIFRFEQRAFHFLFQSAAWRRRIGARYEGANGVRAGTRLTHQCVLNSLPSFYQPGDFVLHLAGIKGVVKCLLFQRHYYEAAAAFGLTPGVDAALPANVLRCLDGGIAALPASRR